MIEIAILPTAMMMAMRNELASMTQSGGAPEVVTNPRNEGGPARLCADLSKARRLLNYDPQVPLERGLQLTYESDARLHKSGGTNHAGS